VLKQQLIKSVAPASVFFALVILLACAQSFKANAQTSSQVIAQGSPQASMQALLETALPGARVVGEGELRVFGFKIYDAQLWMERREALAMPKDPAKLFDQAFALDLRYARNIKGDEIAARSLSEMRRLGLGDDTQQERWLAAMKRVFTNVAKGDHITGVYKPGAATRFFLNEKILGTIDEADFGPAFFSIWLDPRTRAPRLREALMKVPH
jgi:Chalcone isomerase-like